MTLVTPLDAGMKYKLVRNGVLCVGVEMYTVCDYSRLTLVDTFLLFFSTFNSGLIY